MKPSALILGAAVTSSLAGCTGEIDYASNRDDIPSFEEFEAATYHEVLDDGEAGVYIVNGDEPVVDVKALEEYYDLLYAGDGALIVNRAGNQDDRWNNTVKLNLTYCVSNSFGANKAAVVDAMRLATDEGWEDVANVNFVHATAQDGSCNASNGNVVFDVRPTSGQPYLARAFFPNQGRSSRNVLIDSSAFGNTGWSLSGIVAHELGHALGFRHEHTRPEAGQCFEDNNWRPLTPYDSTSVMHYPQCGGTGPALQISARDAQGAAALYGAPSGGGEDPPPPPPPPPGDGTPQTGSASGSVARYAWVHYNPLAVLEGTRLTVTMTGSGDPDLYIRFGAQPTTSAFACRPYLDGASETCAIDVPTGATAAHIGIRGYTAASYSITASWTSP